MLTKKGQMDDSMEMVIAGAALVLGFVFIGIFSVGHQINLQDARSEIYSYTTDVQVFDAKFMGTDLLNLLRLSVEEDLTFGELSAHFPSTYVREIDSSHTGLLQRTLTGTVTGSFTCTTKLQAEIHGYLEPTYGNSWRVVGEAEDGTRLFSCGPAFTTLGLLFDANMTIPGTDPNVNVVVKLEVYRG